MNVFSRRRDEKPAASGPGQPPVNPAEARAAELAGPMPRTTRDPDTMSLAPKPGPTPTLNVGPTPPAGTAIPPRPATVTPSAPLAPAAPLSGTPGPRAAGPERRTLVVGRGISLQGTVSDAERLVVEGTVESQMIQATELAISQTGVFKGEVQVEDAEIAGTFDGTLTARGSLVIRTTGRVIGVARCRRLSVEDGGQISGRMEMLGDAPAMTGPLPRPALAEG